MTNTVNTQGTCGDSLTILLPANFSLYHAQRDLMTVLRTERNEIQRCRINMLREMMQSRDEAKREGDAQRVAGLDENIERQIRLIETVML